LLPRLGAEQRGDTEELAAPEYGDRELPAVGGAVEQPDGSRQHEAERSSRDAGLHDRLRGSGADAPPWPAARWPRRTLPRTIELAKLPGPSPRPGSTPGAPRGTPRCADRPASPIHHASPTCCHTPARSQ